MDEPLKWVHVTSLENILDRIFFIADGLCFKMCLESTG